MDIVGYCDPLSVAPGETIRFRVSARSPRYDARLVRLFHGDRHPEGPGFRARPVPSAIDGAYPGREQAIRPGSYVDVPDAAPLRPERGFTLSAWLYPTTPEKGVQGVLTKWDAAARAGYALVVDEAGGIALWLGDGSAPIVKFATGVALRPRAWYHVAASFDPERRMVVLHQRALLAGPDDPSCVSIERPAPARLRHATGPFLMAAMREPEGVSAHFNGRIDTPCLFDRAFSMAEIPRSAAGSAGQPAPVAAWDFSADMGSDRVTDRGPAGLHGRSVNLPTRAVTGFNWTGDELDFRRVPEQYGAIHFHDDDLEDAGWEVAFELTVPSDLPSAVYAVELRATGAVDHVPFFVKPAPGGRRPPIAFLAPTLSYLAYANESQSWRTPIEVDVGRDVPGGVGPEDRYIAQHRLLSTYERHADGTGVAYSSRLRPIPNMRPDYRMPLLGSSHQFGADLHLVDWLDAKGFVHDVITDEDLHADGEPLLDPYRVILTGSHPEYWTHSMLDAMERYLARGGRLMYLGGNGFYWVTSVDPTRPHVIEIRRGHGGTRSWASEPGECHHSTTGEPGGLWRHRGRAPQRLTGVGFTAQGFDRSLPYRRLPGSRDPRAAFIFEGVPDEGVFGDFGLCLGGGAAGFEVERVDERLGTPTNTILLATSAGRFSNCYQALVEDTPTCDSRQGGQVSPLVRADMTYLERENGAAVFATGSIAWCGALSFNRYDNAVSRITENVLRRFAT